MKKFNFLMPLLAVLFTLNSAIAQIENGVYYIQLGYNNNLMEAQGACVGNNGCQIQVWGNVNAQNQMWQVTRTNRNTYKFKNIRSNKVLDAHNVGVNTNGCKVQLWDDIPNNLNQEWIITTLYNGKFVIRNAASTGNKVLDVTSGNIITYGTAIQLWDYNMPWEQRQSWSFIPAGFDAIMWFPPNLSETEIANFKLKFQARELQKTMPSQVRLWRFPPVNTGAGFNYNSPSEGIGTVGGHTSSIGGSSQSNSPISLPTQEVITGIQSNDIDTLLSQCPLFDFRTVNNLPIGTQSKVKVAILDTGLECDAITSDGKKIIGINFINKRLQKFIWRNEREIQKNAYIDDDGNGFPDDFNGWNFVSDNNIPNDDHDQGHGTAVAGIVSLRFPADNPNSVCQIVPVKILDHAGKGTLFNLIKGVDYATKIGVDIINISVIAPIKTLSITPLDRAIEQAEKKQILVVCGAGNENKDIYTFPHTPASGGGKNLVVVGSIRCDSIKSDFSNYSMTKVHLFAPGERLPSYTLQRTHGDFNLAQCTGTSFSAPFVAGVAAVLRTHQNVPNCQQLQCAINNGATKKTTLERFGRQGRVLSGKGAYNAFLTGCRQP